VRVVDRVCAAFSALDPDEAMSKLPRDRYETCARKARKKKESM
jgi:hypothetical protein